MYGEWSLGVVSSVWRVEFVCGRLCMESGVCVEAYHPKSNCGLLELMHVPTYSLALSMNRKWQGLVAQYQDNLTD